MADSFQNSETDRPDASRLLRDFVSSGRDEAAFRRLVGQLGKLVHSSALRRTGDTTMAEEVTQNVFADLARKADGLVRHPSVMAWIFKATRYESSKAMRADQRWQRKHDRLAAAQPTGSMTSAEPDQWEDALPHLDASLDALATKDRDAVFQRFYEGRKFADIAAAQGSSEAACKMRVKRALEKLSGLLASRGVALSVSAIATSLSAELARSAPLNGAAQLTAGALSSGTAAAAQTLGIMSTAKTVTTTAAAVIALAAAPLVVQNKQTEELRVELENLQSRSASLAAQVSNPGSDTATDPSPPDAAAATVRDLIGRDDGELDPESLLNDFFEAFSTQDTIGLLKVFLPLNDLDAEEFHQLMVALDAREADPGIKRKFREMLAQFAIDGTEDEELDKLVAGGDPRSASKMLASWAERDPEAALAWFRENRDSGTIEGTAVVDRSEEILLAEMLGGIARNHPARAIDLYIGLGADPTSGFDRTTNQLASELGSHLSEGRGAAEFQRLLDFFEDSDTRKRVVESALRQAVPRGDIDAAGRLLANYVSDITIREEIILKQITVSSLEIDEQIEAARKHLPEESTLEAVEEIANFWGQVGRKKIRNWLAEQPGGEVRDAALGAIVRLASVESDFSEAYTHASEITDEQHRLAAMRTFAMRWILQDETAALAALPAEILKEFDKDTE